MQGAEQRAKRKIAFMRPCDLLRSMKAVNGVKQSTFKVTDGAVGFCGSIVEHITNTQKIVQYSQPVPTEQAAIRLATQLSAQ